MEDQESLQTCALVCQLSDAIQYQIHNLFANGVMTPGIVVGCILLSGNKLLRMKELTIGARPDLIYKYK